MPEAEPVMMATLSFKRMILPVHNDLLPSEANGANAPKICVPSAAQIAPITHISWADGWRKYSLSAQRSQNEIFTNMKLVLMKEIIVAAVSRCNMSVDGMIFSLGVS